jgi:YD repeat-containing protein
MDRVSWGLSGGPADVPLSSLDDGNLWYFNGGRGVTVDLSNVASGITLHGPSGFSTFFAADSAKANGFDDAPGLHASIAATGSGTYTVTFAHTGELWGFHQFGSFLMDGDKNGNAIQYTYGGNGDLNTITDTQGRTVTLTHGTDTGNNLHQVTSYTISTTDGTSKTITHGYTGFSLTSLTNGDLKTTGFQYDSGGRITKITDPLGQSTSFDQAPNCHLVHAGLSAHVILIDAGIPLGVCNAPQKDRMSSVKSDASEVAHGETNRRVRCFLRSGVLFCTRLTSSYIFVMNLKHLK